ncbi:MAG: AAA family ATPase [Bdellovibrionales bacterium RBG_16_40_8]|nr:MAG: AAA family ATPase [Bdellovibrionales bacterium RBG_16_40_8]
MTKITHDRSLLPFISKALPQKMVFLGGPRQVGKTTLALYLLGKDKKKTIDTEHPAYLNWDIPNHRKKLMLGELPPGEKFIVLDEIHKYAKWRNLVKGFYDGSRGKKSFIITGSARLDYYRRGGDSIQGRYRYFRLHPYSVNELGLTNAQDIESLLRYGGFPEPFSRQDETELRLWQRDRIERVVYDDLRDLEIVKEISLIEELVEALPARVSSCLSIKSLREDLQVSHEAVERWVSILERLYYCYRIPPYGSPRIRAVKKEQKLYLWDWSSVTEDGPCFENLVASQLLKFCHFKEDTEGFKMELRFLRDTNNREVDFVVLKDKKPLFAVECKTGERQVSPAIYYFSERVPIPQFYQVHRGQRDFEDKDAKIRVLPFYRFCKELEMP